MAKRFGVVSTSNAPIIVQIIAFSIKPVLPTKGMSMLPNMKKNKSAKAKIMLNHCPFAAVLLASLIFTQYILLKKHFVLISFQN